MLICKGVKGRAAQCGDKINVLSENKWYFGRKNITEHASPNGCNATAENKQNRICHIACFNCNINTENAENRKTDSICKVNDKVVAVAVDEAGSFGNEGKDKNSQGNKNCAKS